MADIMIERIVGFRKKNNGIITRAARGNIRVKKGFHRTGSYDLLLSRNVYPYCVDFEKSTIYFIETSQELKNNEITFFYEPLQSAAAKHLLTANVHEFIEFVQGLDLPQEPDVLFIHHPGRCGSTLLHKLMASHPSIESFSEDLVIENVLTEAQPDLSERLYRLLVLLTAHKFIGGSERRLLFKITGRKFRWFDRLLKILPSAKHIYLTRDPVTISESILNLILNRYWSGVLHPFYFRAGFHNMKMVRYGETKSPDALSGFDFQDPHFDRRVANMRGKHLRISMAETAALRVLILDEFFAERLACQKLLYLRYEDILSKDSIAKRMNAFLGFDLAGGIDERIYGAHSQTGGSMKQRTERLYRYTDRERGKLQKFLTEMSRWRSDDLFVSAGTGSAVAPAELI